MVRVLRCVGLDVAVDVVDHVGRGNTTKASIMDKMPMIARDAMSDKNGAPVEMTLIASATASPTEITAKGV